MIKKLAIVLLCTLMISCAELSKIASQLEGLNSNTAISNTENIAGLKNSLDIGIENAVKLLGNENAFLNDALIKIMLPPEAQPIVDNLRLIPGGDALVQKAITSLNRSAEDAVKEAIPIFKTAIRNMTFDDVRNILFGQENAATEFLRRTTYQQLQSAFAPKVKNSLEKPLVANVSTTETWNLLHNNYNNVAKSTVGRIAGLKEVDIDIENYVTQKALDALFLKVAQEEKSIRTDPMARVNDLLKRVFGQLDKK